MQTDFRCLIAIVVIIIIRWVLGHLYNYGPASSGRNGLTWTVTWVVVPIFDFVTQMSSTKGLHGRQNHNK